MLHINAMQWRRFEQAREAGVLASLVRALAETISAEEVRERGRKAIARCRELRIFHSRNVQRLVILFAMAPERISAAVSAGILEQTGRDEHYRVDLLAEMGLFAGLPPELEEPSP